MYHLYLSRDKDEEREREKLRDKVYIQKDGENRVTGNKETEALNFLSLSFTSTYTPR